MLNTYDVNTYILSSCSENIQLENYVNKRLNKHKKVACKKILWCTNETPVID
jgi:hypothetical protein